MAIKNNILISDEEENSLLSELTEEGRQMWLNISNHEKIANGESLLQYRKKKIKLNMFEVELMFIRTELRRMIENSKKVISDCENIIKLCKTKEDYLSSEAKTAKLLHERLILRLQKILDSKNAFDHHIEIDDEEPRHQKASYKTEEILIDDKIELSSILT